MDYLYLSFTNCTALSPTDTMPLKTGVKLLMMLQGLGALITSGVIVSRDQPAGMNRRALEMS